MSNKFIKILGLLSAVAIIVGAGIFIKWQIDKNGPVAEGVKVIPSSGKITLDQLKQNKTSQSCWVGVQKKVYDLTKYEMKHPGGKELFNGCGKEIDSLFPAHPGGRFDKPENLETIKPYFIGDLSN
jgi:Cytochrome b5-like Heme/Steroid binding domain